MAFYPCRKAALVDAIEQSAGAAAPIVIFNSQINGIPLAEFIANITPVQAGTGDPSPSNPRPITGWSEVNVGNSGKNLFNKNAAGLITNKYVAQDGTETENNYFSISDYIRIDGSEIAVSGSTNSGNAPSICFYDGAKNFISGIKHSNYSFPHTYTVPTGAVYLRESISNLYLDTFQLELGSTATAYQPYTGQTATINLGGTYYGGTLNVGTGLLTITHANIASYNGETINEPWLCSEAVYLEGATPPTGSQVVYPLTTHQTYQLTPAQITQILGENNVFADSGDSSIKYYKLQRR